MVGAAVLVEVGGCLVVVVVVVVGITVVLIFALIINEVTGAGCKIIFKNCYKLGNQISLDKIGIGKNTGFAPESDDMPLIAKYRSAS